MPRDGRNCTLKENDPMKTALVSILLLSFAVCFNCAAETPTNELPMYGNVPFTEHQKKINEDFLQSCLKEFGTRKAAAENALSFAWSYYREGNKKTAMKRFNQAWLLDPDNANAFFGFGFLVSEQGKIDEAIKYYKKAVELKPDFPVALSNLGREYYNKAYSIYLQRGRKDQEAKKYLDEALKLYERAAKAAKTDKSLKQDDIADIYYQWAVSLEFNGEYSRSWEKIKTCREYGGKCIQPAFITELTKFMPEPKGPPTAVRDETGKKAPEKKPDFVLSGIMYDPKKPEAMINDKIVKAGDTVDGATVVEIKRENVRMNYNGREIRLDLIR